MGFTGVGTFHRPNVALVTITLPVMLRALAPAVPHRFVLSLVIRAPEDEAVLRPDDRRTPVPADFSQKGRDGRPLLTAHADVKRTVHVCEQLGSPAAAEGLPG